LLLVALDDEVPDGVAPAAFPAEVPVALREAEVFGDACVLCGEQ
jgi:hypothetical protein